MLVTDKQVYMDPIIKQKLDLLIGRCNKGRDALLLVDGYEGYGKTNIAGVCCYYVSKVMNRPYSVDNIFFDVNEMISFASRTEKQIIHWDEAILGGMAKEWGSPLQIKLIKLLGICRKKNHFFVFVIPRFYYLSPALIDRAMGLIHVWSPDGIKMGYFGYFMKDHLKTLYNTWRKRRDPMYAAVNQIAGRFGNDFYAKELVDIPAYEAKKDKAILSVDDTEKVGRYGKLFDKVVTNALKSEELKDLSLHELSRVLGIHRSTLSRYRNNQNA